MSSAERCSSRRPPPRPPPAPAFRDSDMLRSRGDHGEELEPLHPRHPDSLAASPSRTPVPSPVPKRPRQSPHHHGAGGNGGLPEYLEGLQLDGGGLQPRPLPLWQLLLAGGLLLTVALVAVDYEMQVCSRQEWLTALFCPANHLSPLSNGIHPPF